MSTNPSFPNPSITAPDSYQKNAENDTSTPRTGSEPADHNGQLRNDSCHEVECKILARLLVDFIIPRVSKLNEGAHTDQMNVADFKAFWRENFDQMRLELAHAQQSDLLITNPPLKELEIEILDDASEKAYCPCCLNVTDAQIVLRATQGITQDVFLRGLQDQLYGKSDRLRLSDRHYGMLMVRDWEYMITAEDVLLKGSNYSAMRIWLYCSDKMIEDDRQVGAVAKL